MIGLDNTFLSLLLHPKAKPPLDPSTGQPVDRLDDRIELLLEDLELANEIVLIPTPALSEFLVLAENDGPKYLRAIGTNPIFRISDFDTKAAIELAAMNLSIRSSKSGKANKRADAQGTWAKITFDRQIVAIAKANGARTIYSDDEGVEKFARHYSIAVVRTWELPLPGAKQMQLPDEDET